MNEDDLDDVINVIKKCRTDEGSSCASTNSSSNNTFDGRDVDGWGLIHIAAKVGNTKEIDCLVDNAGIQITDKTDKGKNILHIASECGETNIIKYACTSGYQDSSGCVNINELDTEYNESPIHYAVKKEKKCGEKIGDCNTKRSNYKVVKLLIESGADIDLEDRDGKTPLQLSIEKNDNEKMTKLLNGRALFNLVGSSELRDDTYRIEGFFNNLIDINYSNYTGWTPLHNSARMGYADVTEFLINKGAQTNARTHNGSQPLHIAAKYGNRNVVALLLEKCKSKVDNTTLGYQRCKPKVDDKGEGLFTPLHYAVVANQFDVVKYLTEEEKAHLGAEDKDGNTPLHIAAKEGNCEIAKFFLDNGMDITSQNYEGNTPLALSSDSTITDLILAKLLFDAIKNDETLKFNGYYNDGVNDIQPKTDYKDKDGRTLLHLASWHRNNAIAKILIKNGADVNAIDNVNQTSLHLAASRDENYDVVKSLIDNGASADKKDLRDENPLHVAAKFGHEEIVELLLNSVTNVNAIAQNQNTALHLAADNNHPEVVELLLKKGVDVDSKNYHNKTPLDLAENHIEVRKLLSIKGLFNAIKKNDKLKVNWYVEKEPGIINYKGIGIEGNDFPITYAAKKNDYEIIKLLIEKNANVGAVDHNGNKAIHVAAKNDNRGILQILFLTGELNIDDQGQNNWTPLHFATAQNHVDTAKYLLEEEANIDAKTLNGSNALHIAARNGHKEMVEFLLDAGLSIDSVNLDNATPLHQAIEHNKPIIVELLINKGARVDLKNNDGKTPLQLDIKKDGIERILLNKEIFDAIEHGDKSRVQTLLSGSQSDSYLNKWGWKPLHYATSLRDDLSIVKFLVEERNANIRVKTPDGDEPLHIAAKHGHLEVAKYFLQRRSNGANIVSVNDRGRDNWTALHYAVNSNHPEIVDFFIKSGADIAAEDNFSITPLQIAGDRKISELLLNRSLLRAVNRNDIDEVKRYIRQGADVNYLDLFSNNEPLLHNASKRGFLEIVKILTNSKGSRANINVLDSDGNQSMHVAAQYGRTEVVEFFLGKLNINDQNSNGWTPFHYACEKGGLEVVKILTDNGADVVIQDFNGDKAIHIAAKNGHKNIIELLFTEYSNQLSINEKGNRNWTPLHYTSAGGYLEIVKLLVQDDANINALSLDNKIPLTLATENNHLAIKKFLLEKALSNAIEQNNSAKVQEYSDKIAEHKSNNQTMYAVDDGWTFLHDAASRGNIDIVETLFDSGRSVDAGSYGMKPIHCASKYGHKDVVEFFLNKSQKNIDHPGPNQWTPLYYATRYGNKAVVELLVSRGANVNLGDSDGDKPLHVATRYGYKNIVEFFLSRREININDVGANNKTALHYAAEKNHLAIAELLVEKDADISIKDVDQNTPLKLAMLKDNAEIATLLQREELFSAVRNEDCEKIGNSVNCSKIEKAIDNGADINMKDRWGRSALHIAALAGNLATAKFLIEEKSANTRIRDYNGNNPLHIATLAEELPMIKLLVEKGNANIHTQNYNGENPLHIAAKYGYKDIADFFLESGLNVDSLSGDNWTPLHYGVNAGHLNIVKLLVEKGAKIRAKNSDNKSPLEIAKENGKAEIINLLRNEELAHFVVANNIQKVKEHIDSGADINYQSLRSPRCSLLCYAAQKNHLRILKFLVYNGADFYISDSHGDNPLHVAAKNGNKDIVEFLLSNGIEINRTGGNNFTPLHHAITSTNNAEKLDLVNLLIDSGIKISHKDFRGNTALELAINKQKSTNFANRRNYVSIIQALLDSSLFEAIQHRDLRSIRSYFDIGTGANIDAVNRNDFTPLHEATLIGDLRITEFLLSKYPNVYYRDHQYGFLPLHTAIKGGNLEVAKLLISKYPGINYKAREDITPLHIGAQYASVEILELLLHFNKGYKGLSVNDADSKGWTALHYAAKGGNLEVIKFLTEKGVNIDAIDSNNLKALHIAALYGHENAVKFFTEAKHSSLNDRDKSNKTLMHYAAQGGNLDIINFLISKGLSADTLDIDGINPLHIACEYGRVNAVGLFLEYGLNINDADLNNKTPLHYAAKSGNLEVVKLLNSNEANINSHHVKPLHIAAQYGYRDIVEFFVVHEQQSVSNRGDDNRTPLHYAASGGVDLELVEKNALIKTMEFLLHESADINVQDEYGLSPLHIASMHGNKAVADFLIQRGANANCTDIHQSTPLHYTSRKGNLGIAKLLVEEGADPHLIDDQGKNPAHSAAKNGHKNVALFLIRNGVDIDTVDTSNAWSLLHYASDSGDLDFVQLLLSEGADIYKTNSHNEKPIHIAAAKGYKEIVGRFMESGLSVDDFGKHHRTPLHYAVRGNHLEAVKYLVERSANIFSVNSIGDKALHVASKHGYQEIIRFFIDKGLSVNDAGHNGWTPLHYAAERGRVRIVRFLIEEMRADINRLTVNYEKPLDLAQDKNNHRVVRYLQRVASHDRDRVHIRTKRSSFAVDELQPAVCSNAIKPSFFMVDLMVSAKDLFGGFFPKASHEYNTKGLDNFGDTVLPSITPNNFFNCENMSLVLCVADAIDGNRRKHEKLQQVTPYTVRPAFTAKEALETFKISIKQKLQDYNKQDRTKIYSDLSPILPKIKEDLQKSVESDGRYGLDACMRLHLKQFSNILDSYEKHSSKVPTLVSCVDVDCKNLSCAFY